MVSVLQLLLQVLTQLLLLWLLLLMVILGNDMVTGEDCGNEGCHHLYSLSNISQIMKGGSLR